MMLRRVAATTVRNARQFTSTTATRKDLVQDLYLRELKAYKPASVAANAHVGAVKEYHAPAAPSVPEIPRDLAAELAAYDASSPDVAGAEAAAATSAHQDAHHSEDGPIKGGAPAFLAFLEADIPKHDEHHH